MQKNNTKTAPVALVTGGARRIGAAIVEHLHEQGMNVIIHYRDSQAAATKLSAQLNAVRANSACVMAQDLTAIAQLTPFIAKAASHWQRLDYLINNAANFIPAPMGEIDEAAWQMTMTANLQAPFFLSQAAAPYLAKQQGAIVNIADIHGSAPMTRYSVYCISKAGLLMMTKVLAKELAPAVRVNAVSPGPGVWPEGSLSVTTTLKTELIAKTALKRPGNAWDVAEAVGFLLNAGLYTTGHELVVDGGRCLRS